MTVLHTQHRAINRLHQATRMILRLTRLRLHVTVSFLRHHRLFSSEEGLHGLLNPVAWLTIHLASACWLFYFTCFRIYFFYLFFLPVERSRSFAVISHESLFYKNVILLLWYRILCEMNFKLLVSRLLCWFFDIARFGSAKPCELLISCKIRVCLQKIAL